MAGEVQAFVEALASLNSGQDAARAVFNTGTEPQREAALQNITITCQALSSAVATLIADGLTLGTAPVLAAAVGMTQYNNSLKVCQVDAQGLLQLANDAETTVNNLLQQWESTAPQSPTQTSQAQQLLSAASNGDVSSAISLANEIGSTWNLGDGSSQPDGSYLQNFSPTTSPDISSATWDGDWNLQSTLETEGSTTTQTIYDNDGSGSVSSQIMATPIGYQVNVLNPSTGAQVLEADIGIDGSYTLQYYDPVTHNVVYSQQFDRAGHLISETPPPGGFSVNQFAGVVANALAAQAISQFLIKNNLPASLLAQAFAKSSIDAITSDGPVTADSFANDFSSSLTAMAGAILGADAGQALFKEIGLPPQLGSLVGSTLTQAATQQLASYISNDVLGINIGLGPNVIDEGLSMDDFETGLANGFKISAASLAGSLLEQALFQNKVGPGSSIGASLGSAIGSYIGSEVFPVIGSIAGSFIGDFIGSLIGGLFGGNPSVGPDAESVVAYNGAAFYIRGHAPDNGGDVTISDGLANAEISELNTIMDSMGAGVMAGPSLSAAAVAGPVNTVGYIVGNYFFSQGAVSPQTYYTNFSDANALVDYAVMQELRSAIIGNGNPYMEFALEKSTATTVAGLTSDLNAAYDYSKYVVDPAAFDAALAMTGDATQISQWEAELTQAQALGLDRVSFEGNGAIIQSSSSQLTGDLATLRNLGGGFGINYTGMSSVTSVTLTVTGGQLVDETGASFGTVIGTVDNYAGTGQSDIVTSGYEGQLTVWALDSNGHPVFAQTIQASVAVEGDLYTPTGTVIGAARNLLGAGGYDILLKNGGQTTIVESDLGGNKLAAETLPFALDTGAQIVGAGVNFLNVNGTDVFVRQATGQVIVKEIGDSEVDDIGEVIGSLSLDTVAVLPSNATIIGSANGFFNSGGYDLVFDQGDGTPITVWEYNSSGEFIAGQTLDSSFTLADGSRIVGAGSNVLSAGGQELFVAAADGSITLYEFSSGTLTQTVALLDKNDDPLTIGADQFVAGTTIDSVSGNIDFLLGLEGGNLGDVETRTAYGAIAPGQYVPVGVVGTSGSDPFFATGLSGNIWMTGNGGNDTYGVNLTERNVIINNGLATNSGPSGTLNLPSSVSQLSLSHVGNDLVVDVLGTDTVVTVKGWFAASWSQLATINIAGTALTNAQINAFVAEGTWDVFVAAGSTGTDTVLQNGSASNPGPTGSLIFTGSVSQLSFTQSGNDLVIGMPGTATAVTLTNWYANTWSQVASISLPNGVVLTNAEINGLPTDGTPITILGSATAGSYSVSDSEGSVLIQNGTSTNSGPTGTLTFTGAVNQLSFTQSGNDLVIGAPTTEDDVTIQGWFSNSWAQVESLTLPNGTTLTNAEINQLVTNGTPIIGTGANAEGLAGSDAFLQLANGSLEVIEGSTGAKETLTGLALPPGTRAMGTGTDFDLQNGKDVFFQEGNGQTAGGVGNLYAAEYSGATFIESHAVTWAPILGGGDVGVSQGMGIIGTGIAFEHDGGRDLVMELPDTNQLYVAETDAQGDLISAQELSGVGGSGLFALDANASVAGTGEDFLSTDGSDLFYRRDNGQLVIDEFNGLAELTGEDALMSGVVPFTIDAGTRGIGNAINYLGSGGFDVVFRLNDGQLADAEVSGNQVIAYRSFENGNGTEFTVDNGEEVVGGTSTTNFLGTGSGSGNDLLIRTDSGALSAYQFNTTTGKLETSEALKETSTISFNLPVGARVVGTGQFFSTEHDLFIETADYRLYVARFNSSGTEIFATSGLTSGFVNFGGSPMYLDQAAYVSFAQVSGSNDQISISQANGSYVLDNITTTEATLNVDGSSTSTGTSAANILAPSGVASTLIGNGGADTYYFDMFGQRNGMVTIQNGITSSNTAAGTIDLGASDENLWFKQSGNNLVVSVIGDPQDQLTIGNWYAANENYARVTQFTDASNLKLTTGLNSLVQAMATYAANNPGFNPVTATAMPTDTTLQTAIAANWRA